MQEQQRGLWVEEITAHLGVNRDAIYKSGSVKNR